MGRPRIPTNILELKGSFKKHPDRRRKNEPVDDRNVKELRARIDTERKAYNVLIKSACPGVLRMSDSVAVWLACKLLVRIDSGDYTASDAAQFRSLLAQFGMTPAARAGLSIPEPEKPNPFADI